MIIILVMAMSLFLPFNNQGGEAGSDETKGSIIFPITARCLKIVCNDVYYGTLSKMGDSRSVTLLQRTLTNEKIDWITDMPDLGSFGWIGCFIK